MLHIKTLIKVRLWSSSSRIENQTSNMFFCLIPGIIMATANIRMLVNIHQSHKHVSDVMHLNRSNRV